MTLKSWTSRIAFFSLLMSGASPALAAGEAPATPRRAFDFDTIGGAIWQDAQRWYASVDLVELALSAASAFFFFVVVYFGLTFGLRKVAERLNRAGERNERAQGYLTRARDAATLAGHVIGRTSGLFILVAALHAAGFALPLPQTVRDLSHSIFVIAFVLQAAMWATALATEWLENYASQRSGGQRSISAATTIIGLIARTALWSIALMLILDNLGMDITALIAGLGVGGIAVGLAAQNILGDLFASLSIVLDKPFEIGDFIISGDYMGTVEKIGLKTTRLRSLSGEQVIIANADLLTSRVRNYKRMAERRVAFTLGVAYGTSPEAIKRIPAMIRAAIEGQEKTKFDRSNLAALSNTAVSFETVYYVLSSDYNLFAEIHEAVLLRLYRQFESEDISFALAAPTAFVSGIPRPFGGKSETAIAPPAES